jgi:serine/threonine-protein kinase
MGDITGTTFAGYQVGEVIGTDLVSALHRATVPDEDRTVALRVIAQDLCEVEGPDRQLYRRFRAQATASLTFEHPFSPMVEEIGEHRGLGYLVSPFIDTVPLSQLVNGHSLLAVDAALELFEELADVLDSGQDAGLTHGAVSPSTVAFARPGENGRPQAAYLAGYGVGALLELRLKRDRKQLTVVDDLLYVAPEQLRQQQITGRTDQYALACALVHVLTGEPPFVRDSIGGLFGAHLFVEPELDASEQWTAAVRKGMAKEPEQRFENCGDLIAAVRSAASNAVTRVVTPVAEDAARTVTPSAVAVSAREARQQAAAAAGEAGVPAPTAREGATRSLDQPPPPAARGDRNAPDDEAVVFATSSPTEWRNGARPPTIPDDDDTPLLSEVLSQHKARRRSSGTRSRVGALLLLGGLVAAAIVAVLLLWP